MDKAHLLVVRHCPEVVSSVLPAVILVLLPKCPVCIAAYIAVVTGIGLSLPVTAHLRTLLVILCSTSLIYFVARQIPPAPRPESVVVIETQPPEPREKSS
jgi:hypothetical protein